MKIKILNNSLSPSFLIKGKKNILVNTPKGYNLILKDKIDAVLFTSDDMYHTYDIKYLKDKQIPCYIFKEFESEISKKIKENDLSLSIEIIKPYKKFLDFTPIMLHKTKIGISSSVSMGLKIDNKVFLSIFKSFTNKSYDIIDNCDLFITVKYAKINFESISLEEIAKIVKIKSINNIGFLGLSNYLKKSFDKKYLMFNCNIKIN
jgi:hypothetical protein